MRKMILSAILICMMVIASGAVSFAEITITNPTIETDDSYSMKIVTADDPFAASSDLDNIGVPIRYMCAIDIDGIEYNLYPVFTDGALALNNAMVLYEEAFDVMKDMYNLENLSSITWQDYYSVVETFKNDVKESNNFTDADKNLLVAQCYRLIEFFDIYENHYFNEEIINRVNSPTLGDLSINSGNAEAVLEKLQGIKTFLPHSTGAVNAVNELICQTADEDASLLAYSGNSSFNVNTGVNYALANYNNTNSTKYGYVGSNVDCTNFASQIKHEGGVPLYGTVNSSSGWTYSRTDGPSGSYYYNYATNWTLAEGFANFFGEKALYPSGNAGIHPCAAFSNFSRAVQRGSFICFDAASDGNWDHIGFVTAISSNNVALGSYTYRDFHVSQHSREYGAYVSSSTNGWEDLALEYNNVIFGIIN